MKKVVLVAVATVVSAGMISCKNETPEATLTADPQIEATLTAQDEPIAMASLTEEKVTEDQYMYVTAPSGLTLRAYANSGTIQFNFMMNGVNVNVLSSSVFNGTSFPARLCNSVLSRSISYNSQSLPNWRTSLNCPARIAQLPSCSQKIGCSRSQSFPSNNSSRDSPCSG